VSRVEPLEDLGRALERGGVAGNVALEPAGDVGCDSTAKTTMPRLYVCVLRAPEQASLVFVARRVRYVD